MLVADIYRSLDERFPFANAAQWDPVGLQLGDLARSIDGVGVAHEVTDDVVDAVASYDINTLVSYHPLFFSPVTSVVAGKTPEGRAMRLIEAGVSLIIVHTAMDAAPLGTGDALLAVLGVESMARFAETDEGSGNWIGRSGSLPTPTTVGQFADLVSAQLSTLVHVAGDTNEAVGSVATVPGSGSSFIDEAAQVADVYLTGDVSHHRARQAVERGLVVLDAGHVPTERPGVDQLYDSVRNVVPDAVFIASDPHPWEDISWKT